jgi:hypothetical protein
MNCHKTLRGGPRFAGNHGIAIGPILFLIAILAILAAAIAAGSGSFSGGTTNENAKVMAQFVIDWTSNIDNAVQKIKNENGYTDAQISFEIPSGELTKTADGTDFQSWTTNANCTVDGCKVFKPAGGGLTPTAWPMGVFSSLANLQNNWGDPSYCAATNNEACRYPLLANIGLSPLAVAGINLNRGSPDSSAFALGLYFISIDKDVCVQINNIVGVKNPGGLPPTTSNIFFNFGNTDTTIWDGGNYPQYYTFSGVYITGKKNFCYLDSGLYCFVHLFL